MSKIKQMLFEALYVRHEDLLEIQAEARIRELEEWEQYEEATK